VEFCIGDAHGREVNVLKHIKFVTAYSHSNTVRFGFSVTHSANKIGIGDFAISGNLAGQNEIYCAIA
jgi:hypothetical protein